MTEYDLSFAFFQDLSRRTMNLNDSESGLNAALGLAGESGEVIEHVKKWRFHDKELDMDALRSEIGDVLFYVAYLCHTFDISMSDCAKENLEKLRERWPEGFGKPQDEQAVQRQDNSGDDVIEIGEGG